jgi:hypothetical protein
VHDHAHAHACAITRTRHRKRRPGHEMWRRRHDAEHKRHHHSHTIHVVHAHTTSNIHHTRVHTHTHTHTHHTTHPMPDGIGCASCLSVIAMIFLTSASRFFQLQTVCGRASVAHAHSVITHAPEACHHNHLFQVKRFHQRQLKRRVEAVRALVQLDRLQAQYDRMNTHSHRTY